MTMVVIHLKFITMVGHLSQYILTELCVKLLNMCVLSLLIHVLPTSILPISVLPNSLLPLSVLKLLARSDHPGGLNLQAHKNPGGQNLQAHSNKPAGGLNLQAHNVLQSGLTSN